MGWLRKNHQRRPGRSRSSSLDVSTHPSPAIHGVLRKEHQPPQLEEDPTVVLDQSSSSVSFSNSRTSNSRISHHTSSTSCWCLDVSDRTSGSSTSTLQTTTLTVLPLELQEEHLLLDDEEEQGEQDSKHRDPKKGEASSTTVVCEANETAPVIPRKVRFDKVQTRYYAPCPTYNPSVLCGVPIGLDWTILSQQEDKLPAFDDDTTMRGSYRRSYTELRLTSMERTERLRTFGYARSDLARIELRVNRARQQRERTVQQVLRRANWKRRCSSLFSSSFGTSSSSSSAPRGRRGNHMPIEESMF